MAGVSFVVPVHNGAACVREALESAHAIHFLIPQLATDQLARCT